MARHDSQSNLVKWAAWHIAALPRAKTFPDLNEFIGDQKIKSEQTAESMLAAAYQWHAAVNRSS